MKTINIIAVITVFGTVAEMENGGSFCRRNLEKRSVYKVVVDIFPVRIGTDPVTGFICVIIQTSRQISTGKIVAVDIGSGRKVGSRQGAGKHFCVVAQHVCPGGYPQTGFAVSIDIGTILSVGVIVSGVSPVFGHICIGKMEIIDLFLIVGTGDPLCCFSCS